MLSEKPQLIRLSGWWLVEMETDGRETWWWHCLLSGITKSLMEVRIHTSPYWLPTVLSSSLPKNANWRVAHDFSFETGRRPNSLKQKIKYIYSSLFLLQDWLHILKFVWRLSALRSLSSLQFMSYFEFYESDSLLLCSRVKYACHCYQPVTFLLQICHFVFTFFARPFFFFLLVMAHMSEALGVYLTLLLVSSPRHLSISVQWKLGTTAGWVIPLGSRHYFPVTGNRWGFITLELSISKQSIPLILWILGGRFAVAVKVVCVMMMCHTVSLVLLTCESSSLSWCEGLAFLCVCVFRPCSNTHVLFFKREVCVDKPAVQIFR